MTEPPCHLAVRYTICEMESRGENRSCEGPTQWLLRACEPQTRGSRPLYAPQHRPRWALSRHRMQRSIHSILAVVGDTHGPNRTLSTVYECCGRSPHSRHSLQPQKRVRRKTRPRTEIASNCFVLRPDLGVCRPQISRFSDQIGRGNLILRQQPHEA